MTALVWDQIGERLYETGVDHGVLYLPDAGGVYNTGFAWNGLYTVTEAPTGAEANPQYADNMKYLNLYSLEEFKGTIEAFTYPPEFAECDGYSVPQPGITVGQQTRKPFGFSYRTLLGNDLEQTDFAYKLHLIYGCMASPSEKAYNTINESPEAITFSWEVSTTPVPVTGMKPTASIVITSNEVDPTALAELEDMLYGTVGDEPQLPMPDTVLALFAGTLTLATPTEPAFNSGTETITIPTVTGVIYQVLGETVPAGDLVITEDTVVNAVPAPGYYFPDVIDTNWFYDYTP